MKIIFILLLFPSVAFAFITGVPYKKTDICQKIKVVFDKAFADLSEFPADMPNVGKDITNILIFESKAISDKSKAVAVSRYFADTAKAISDKSKAFKEAIKYKCFKQTITCNESLKKTTKAISDKSKAYDYTAKAYDYAAKAYNYRYTSHVVGPKALANIKEYCK